MERAELSPEQRAAVDAPDGPLLVLAGPGSGKTLVLTRRVAALVRERGVGPAGILALTFASKAARELRERLHALLGDGARELDIATFHALGLRIVRQWQEALGYGRGPLIVYGEAEARALLHQLVASHRGAGAQGPEEVERAIRRARLGGGALTAPQRAVLDAYAAAMRRRGAVDFPAMLRLPLRLFGERPAALARYQHAYRNVLCDEFQDVAGVQYALLRALAAEHRNLVLVGDAMQAIYGWRGADGRIVPHFLADFPEARCCRLGQNFRSTGRIVALANGLAAPGNGGERLWTANPAGADILHHVAADADAEAAFVAAEIVRLVADGGVAVDQIAVLFRVKGQATPLVLALRERGVPYRVAGHGDLFASREVRDLLAYLRLVQNPDDAAALARIVNTPPRGLAALARPLRRRPQPLATLANLAAPLGPQAQAGAEALKGVIGDLHGSEGFASPAELLDLVLERTGYTAWLEQQADHAGRLERVAALSAFAARASATGEPPELGDWLAAVALGDDDRGDSAGVTLSTIHAAKGAEWRVVFVVGLEEGLLPHVRALWTRRAGKRPSGGWPTSL